LEGIGSSDYGAEQDLRGADDRNRTRVFSLGSCFATFDHGGWMIDGRIGDHSICGAFPGMRCGWRKISLERRRRCAKPGHWV